MVVTWPALVQWSDVLHWHGCQDPLIAFLDERLAKAFSHRLRLRILERLNEHGVASPSELAGALGEPLGNLSYHVRILRELDCVELIRTEPSGGALEHFYRASMHPGSTTSNGAGCPPAFATARSTARSRRSSRRRPEAGRDGGFDGPEGHASHVELALDEQGRMQLGALLAETLDAVRRINAESTSGTTRATELAIMYFRRDPGTV